MTMDQLIIVSSSRSLHPFHPPLAVADRERNGREAETAGGTVKINRDMAIAIASMVATAPELASILWYTIDTTASVLS